MKRFLRSFFSLPLNHSRRVVVSKTFDPRGGGPFWPQGYNLNKLGRGPLGDMIHTKYQGSSPRGFRQEDFFTFSLYKPM